MTRLLNLPRRAIVRGVRAWVLLWAWAHPAAGPALLEALDAEASAAQGWRLPWRLAVFALTAPLFARRQAAAERRASTRTGDGDGVASPRGSGRLRETLLWVTLAGYALAFALYLHSDITTGKFAPDYAPAPGAPEVISLQFHLAALAAGLPTLALGAALAWSWWRGRARALTLFGGGFYT